MILLNKTLILESTILCYFRPFSTTLSLALADTLNKYDKKMIHEDPLNRVSQHLYTKLTHHQKVLVYQELKELPLLER